MEISLRDYQLDAVDRVIGAFERGVTRQLITLPTGSGKTVVMAAIAKRLGKRTLLLAHREELILQGMDKFKMVWPEVGCGICMGERDELDGFVVFGSVQSCCREKRLQRLRENDFEVLLIDEAHHARSCSYQRVIDGLGFSSGKKNMLMVGVTATPMRSDNKELGDIFEEMTYSISIETMMRGGYLSPIIGRRVLTQVSLDGVHKRSGDFAIGELSEVVNTFERNHFVVETYKKYAVNRKGVAFCCDVQHCKDLADAFRDAQIPAKAVYGDMDTTERISALKELKTGKIRVATSCGVLTEGFDEPTISCVAMARPTRFKGLYIQCVGRGLRLHPSKSDCLVLDFADESHDLEAVANLGKIIPEAEHVDEAIKLMGNKKRQHTLSIKRVCDEEFDVLGGSGFIWIPTGDDEWSLADDDGNEIVMMPQDWGYVAVIFWRDGKRSEIVKSPLPIGYCSGCCEDFARSKLRLNFASKDAAWMRGNVPATEGQMMFLQDSGVNGEGMTKAQASMEIRKIIAKQKKVQRGMGPEPITENQAYFLKKNGNGIDYEGMTKIEAMTMIAKIKEHLAIIERVAGLGVPHDTFYGNG